jgi:hypothetical protein
MLLNISWSDDKSERLIQRSINIRNVQNFFPPSSAAKLNSEVYEELAKLLRPGWVSPLSRNWVPG